MAAYRRRKRKTDPEQAAAEAGQELEQAGEALATLPRMKPAKLAEGYQ
ncbi:MAG: hypothetical protein R3C16_06790 [Hyphomonadaceae bacterium]